LRQTLPELEEDFESKPGHEAVVLKAMLNGKIVGSVRGHLSGDTAHVRRLAVHPYYQRRGIGRRLVVEIQRAFPGAGRIEVCAAQQSQTGVRQFQKLGFQEFKTESFSPTITWVHLQKERS
jgi:ribosomal protein S18 acetylase RimI-like enzyme